MRSLSVITAYQLFFFLLLAVGQVCSLSSDPCDDLEGHKRYWDEDDEECKPCPRCNSGTGVDKLCGNGEGGDAKCVACEPGFYSADFNSESCKPCRICVNVLHTEVECTPKHNRICGPCKPGYYKHLHGTCEPCETAPGECSDTVVTEPAHNVTIPKPRLVPVIQDTEGTDNSDTDSGTGTDGLLIAAIVLPIVATVLIVVLLVIIVYMKKAQKKKNKLKRKDQRARPPIYRRHDSTGDENDAYEQTPNTTRKAEDPEIERLIQNDIESCKDPVDETTQKMLAPGEELGRVEFKGTGDPLQNEYTVESEGLSETGNLQASPVDSPAPAELPTAGQRSQPEGAMSIQADVHIPPTIPDTPKEPEDEAVERRKRALEEGRGLSLSEDLPFHVNQKICQRLKNPVTHFRILASHIGMRPHEVNALDEPKDVIDYMAASMIGKRDIARLITELQKIERYDIIDDVVVKWLLDERSKQEDNEHGAVDDEQV